MRYSQAFEALQERGTSIDKTMQILDVLIYFEFNQLGQRLVLMRWASMDIYEAGKFLREYKYA